MAIHICRLGSPRAPGEGLRIGTVRYLPGGVPKGEYAQRDLFDVWLPNLAPSAELFGWLRSGPLDAGRFRQFARRYRAEMKHPEARNVIGLLAALSHQTDLSVGCYCEDERLCHRSVLRELLREAGARSEFDSTQLQVMMTSRSSLAWSPQPTPTPPMATQISPEQLTLPPSPQFAVQVRSRKSRGSALASLFLAFRALNRMDSCSPVEGPFCSTADALPTRMRLIAVRERTRTMQVFLMMLFPFSACSNQHIFSKECR
jgi:uncharacterized protein YeaO (DUF488 family)